jgi:hypothetical protein
MNNSLVLQPYGRRLNKPLAENDEMLEREKENVHNLTIPNCLALYA